MTGDGPVVFRSRAGFGLGRLHHVVSASTRERIVLGACDAGFSHFDYVNPDAPKGGVVRMSDIGSFDSLNFVPPRGSTPLGLGLIYDTLMTSSMDEVSTEYGLLADAVKYPDDYSSVTYRLREGAKWHDGEPITVDDVMNSRPIATPYKLFDICPRSAGCCAVILATKEVAREKCARPAFVHGIGAIANTVFIGDRVGPYADAEVGEFGELAMAGRECYAMRR